MTDERWLDILASSRDRAYRTLDADPNSLLDGDGGPEGMTADLVFGRLLSADEAVVADVELTRAEPVIYRPVMLPLRRLLAADAMDWTAAAPTITKATYVLQCGYARLGLAFELVPQQYWPKEHTGFTVSLLFLRYRHRF